MTEQILSNRSHDLPIQIDNFVTYLHQHGWQRIDHPNTRLLVFQGVNDDHGYPIQIVLPNQNNGVAELMYEIPRACLKGKSYLNSATPK